MLMVTEALVKCGAREELGFKGILSSILKKLSGRIVGRAGDELVDGIFKYLDYATVFINVFFPNDL